MPRSPGAFASQTIQGARQGISAIARAPAAIGRGARALFSGGRQGLVRFKQRLQGFFRRRRPGDVDLESPPNRRQRADLDEARTRRIQEMEEPQLRAELREVSRGRPQEIGPDSPHYRDYDLEVEANGHTYRRRRDRRGWCRFSPVPEECLLGDDLPDEYFALWDDDLELAQNRRLRGEDGGTEAQRQALEDIRRDIRAEGGNPNRDIPRFMREGLDPKRLEYLGSTPGKRSRTGRNVIDRMRRDGKIRGAAPNEEVFTVGPDGVERWYSIDDMDMGHHPVDAVTYWNDTGRSHGPRSQAVRDWMLDPDNYELQHYSVNRSEGALAGQTEQYLPPR